jgi:TnpA family transposase
VSNDAATSSIGVTRLNLINDQKDTLHCADRLLDLHPHRVLQRDGRPIQLGEAFAMYGWIFKTLHVLTFVDDPAYRREMKAMRNLNEGVTTWPGTPSTGRGSVRSSV